LFFDKGAPTQKIWYYQLNPGRNLGKGKPLSEADLVEFVELQKTKGNSDNSWSLDIKDVNQTTYDLSVKNPSKNNIVFVRDPADILDEMGKIDEYNREIIEMIKRQI